MHSMYSMARRAIFILLAAIIVVAPFSLHAYSGNAGQVEGTVTDSSGAVIPGAKVTFSNPVSEFTRTAVTGADGSFLIVNVPFNNYRLSVTAKGFATFSSEVSVQSAVSVTVPVKLTVSAASTTVEVESGGDLTERDTTFHTDVDRNLFNKMTLESQSSAVSSLVTLTTPGIAQDSNGLFHGLGDHAENSFSVDGQPITDQQSKVFSNQIPLDSVQSLEVISGAPPAEFGDKTSVVIKVTTRSGLNSLKPSGDITTSYGSFGSTNVGGDLSLGNKYFGNFVSISGMNSSRFLDPPEFTVFHDRGNAENFFDRVDYVPRGRNSYQLNVGYTRSWFQTPNTYDTQYATAWSGLEGVNPSVENYGGIDPNGDVVGKTDQRSQIGTFNIAPSWTRTLSNNSVFTLGTYVRRDAYNYYPSKNPFADLGAPSLQRQTVAQSRSLTNAGASATYSYVKGIHNFKAGINYSQTFLNENDSLGIVDPAYNAPCITYDAPSGTFVAVPGFTSTTQCNGANEANLATNPDAQGNTLYPYFNPLLAPYDLTRGGGLYNYNGHTDVKELAVYVEDNITAGNWVFNLGARGDTYNGLTVASQAEPRLGISYNIKPSSTVLRISYARTLETPFNENLILSSLGCANDILNPLLLCSASTPNRLNPGYRNEFHAGFQQAISRYFVTSGEYIWKETHNGYDFSVLGNTPITFPIEWHNSKIPGWALRGSMPNLHGLTAMVVMSSVAARFFTPQIGGAGAAPNSVGAFRIDHDEKYNETTHAQYQFGKRGPWIGFNWRFDSGLVAGNAPCYGINANNDCPQSTTIGGQPAILMQDVVGNPLTPDLEYEAGFTCNGQHATPTHGLPSTCLASQFGSSLINVPQPGTEDDDHNPPRIAPRSLFDASIGDDDLFHGSRYKWSMELSGVNLANKYALYNFLSTFSGTHYVTPRDLTAQLGVHF